LQQSIINVYQDEAAELAYMTQPQNPRPENFLTGHIEQVRPKLCLTFRA